MSSSVVPSMGAVTEVASAGLYGTSCTECHRRKQKCSRQWPCNHCQSRKVSHLCQYTPKKAATDSESPKNDSLDGRKRRWDTPDNEQAGEDSEDLSTAEALKALGYLQVGGDLSHKPTERKKSYLQREIEETFPSIPPKPYCDALVQNYLQDANYQYYIIYPPKFLENYAQWWDQRTKQQEICPELTCLILRVLACSAQSLNSALLEKLETELGENAQALTEKFNRAASRLSSQIPPGSGGLAQVQQLFMASMWYKGETLFVESWHALAHAIRQAQEIGMHDEKMSESVSEFEREIRRRVWCILYVWDRSMGMILARPFMIHDRDCSVGLPSVNLERDPACPEVPSPIMQMTVSCQLLQSVTEYIELTKKRPSFNSALACNSRVQTWFSNLSPIYRIENPDQSYDSKYPFLKRHRHQILIMGYTTIFSILKPFLTQNDTVISPYELEALETLRQAAVDYGIKLMDISKGLFDLIIPTGNTKYFVVCFVPFDTATLFIAALLRDKDRTLPRRPEILQAIAKGIAMLWILRPITKTGSIAWGVLSKLILTLDLDDKERSLIDPEGIILKQRKPTKRIALGKLNKKALPPSPPGPQLAMPEEQPQKTLATPESSTTGDTPEYDCQFDPFETGDAALFEDFDFGDLGPVWDWENLNLPLDDPTFPFQPQYSTLG